ncbi:MAG: bifunctional precorrin-2 dehydrogenase/sirohydrochlorin ferrochelatase [Candidatus Aadella gelida]|nr:bifunctional precorrin-2 dehydrogenase/sirohydrochlorin ferrochelatase [Candidatus Aadella gelida]
MDYFPIALEIKNKNVLVVGGGNVARRKASSLLEARACVRIIAPFASFEVRELDRTGKVEWVRRKVKKSDIKNASLIVAATDDPNVNAKVSKWSKEKGITINVVDDPGLSDYISPAVARFDEAMIAVYTDGKDPVLSRDLKNYLKEKWHDFLLFRNRS